MKANASFAFLASGIVALPLFAVSCYGWKIVNRLLLESEKMVYVGVAAAGLVSCLLVVAVNRMLNENKKSGRLLAQIGAVAYLVSIAIIWVHFA